MANNLSREDVKQLGQRILAKITSKENPWTETTMLPPIPDSRFIDRLPRIKNRNYDTERGHQIGYEAEVKLYRTFEKLKRNLIVIHHLEYTHDQYFAFVPEHLCDSRSCKAGTVQSSKRNKKYSWQSSEDSSTLADHDPPLLQLVQLQTEHPCHNQSNNKDGECDFVVIGEGFVVVFEVKASCVARLKNRDSAGKLERFKASYASALRQREKIIALIRSVTPDVPVFGYTVFSNISREDLLGIGFTCTEENKDLLLSDDLSDFGTWFDKQFPVLPENPNRENINETHVMEELKNVILGLWCMDSKNCHDESICNFANCIIKLDTNLKRAFITDRSLKENLALQQPLLSVSSRPGKRSRFDSCSPSSSASGSDYDDHEIQDSSLIFKKFLDIRCLSKRQQVIFDCSERFLWVNGPAGSGKTLVMQAKILQIVDDQNSNKRVILMCPNIFDCTAAKRHQSFLARIKHVSYHLVEVIDAYFDEIISQISKTDAKITLLKSSLSQSGSFIELLRRLISSLQGSYHIFVDDFQLDKFWTDSGDSPEVIKGFIEAIKDARGKENISVWMFCDLAQQVLYETLYQAKRIEKLNKCRRDELKSSFSIMSLEVNLRNTCDISLFLAQIRQKFTTLVKCSIASHQVGHFLRGTKPTFNMIENSDYDLLNETSILRRELRKLQGLDKVSGDNRIGLLYSDHASFNRHFLALPQKLDITNAGDTNDEKVQKPARISDSVNQTLIDPLKEVVQKGSLNGFVDIERIRDTWSAEWPAVVAVIQEPVFWTELYLAVSRARVHCSVIILGSKVGSDARVFLKELETEHDVCRVIEMN